MKGMPSHRQLQSFVVRMSGGATFVAWPETSSQRSFVPALRFTKRITPRLTRCAPDSIGGKFPILGTLIRGRVHAVVRGLLSVLLATLIKTCI